MARIGIIGAIKEEVSAFSTNFNCHKKLHLRVSDFQLGNFNGHEIALGLSGIGKVMSTMTSQLLIDAFKPDYLLFTGLCGSLDSSLIQGDIVVSTDCVQHDFVTKTLGFKRGEIPFTGILKLKPLLS